MTISAAFGTSTPTSMTVVDTSTSVSPRAKADIISSFSFAFILPCMQAILRSGRAARRASACSSADFMPSAPSSFSSMRGQTMKTCRPSCASFSMKPLSLAR